MSLHELFYYHGCSWSVHVLCVDVYDTAPPAPMLAVSVGATSITVNATVTPGLFIISAYCITIQLFKITGVMQNMLTTLCTTNGIHNFTGLEEDATFLVTGFASNTAGARGPPATPVTVATPPAGEQPCCLSSIRYKEE